jgi:hypothetical protein
MKTITENKIQQEIYLWFKLNYCLPKHENRCMIFSVPNDSSNAVEQQRKVNTGLLAGVSDLIVYIGTDTLHIEVKTSTGRQSDKQKDFENRVNLLGRKYFIVRSLDEFKKIVIFAQQN